MLQYLATLTAIPQEQLVSWTVAFIMFAAAVFERVKGAKKQQRTESENGLISDAKMFQERANIMQETASANMVLYIGEREEHQKTREYWHGKATEYQQTLSNCQDKLQEMNARPDFSDIVKYAEAQAKTSLEILQGIQAILIALKPKLPL